MLVQEGQERAVRTAKQIKEKSNQSQQIKRRNSPSMSLFFPDESNDHTLHV